MVDSLLVMLVHPGFGGQTTIPEMVDKVRMARRILDERCLEVRLVVDGGVNADTAPKLVRAGAMFLVAGSAIFNKREPVADAIQRIRDSVESVER